jgi:hypothetical protein
MMAGMTNETESNAAVGQYTVQAFSIRDAQSGDELQRAYDVIGPGVEDGLIAGPRAHEIATERCEELQAAFNEGREEGAGEGYIAGVAKGREIERPGWAGIVFLMAAIFLAGGLVALSAYPVVPMVVKRGLGGSEPTYELRIETRNDVVRDMRVISYPADAPKPHLIVNGWERWHIDR